MIVFDLLGIIFPVFACAAIGFAWSKLGRPFHSETVTSLVVGVGTPCLVFDTLTRLELTLATFGEMAAASIAALAASGVIAVLWLWAARLDRPTYLPALMFPNSGNMGLPVCFFAFGETGLALAVSYFATMIVRSSPSVAIAAGRLLSDGPPVQSLRVLPSSSSRLIFSFRCRLRRRSSCSAGLRSRSCRWRSASRWPR